jgi:hypothetical protein
MRLPTTALAIGLTSLCLSTPLAAQDVIETPIAKVFAGQWMQSKEADKDGLLMYLTQERAQVGEYFSIRCDEAGRSIRLGFGEKLPRVPGKDGRGKEYMAEVRFAVDGNEGGYLVQYTGATKDPKIASGKVQGYKMIFPDDTARDTFLEILRRGEQLTIGGQTYPISLAGAGAAIEEQAAYCS